MILELIEPLWYGSEASFYEALALEKRIEARLQAGPFDEMPEDYLLQKQGNIGLVTIAGPLTNSDHPILAFFGISSYPAIRRAVVSAAKDPSIDHILLSVDSGGGAVSGVTDTAELIARINKKVKPVTTFAGGTMASAAYWLGSSAEKAHASKTSITGSIGVMRLHVDRTKQLEQEGVKVTVLRSGKFKNLLNPFETPTEAALEKEQEQLDAAYRLFVEHVAAARGVSYDQAHRKMADGRDFFGAAGVEAGLLDSITTLDAVVSALAERKGVDKRRAVYDNGIKGKSMLAATTLTDQEIAALAEGANLGAKPDEELVSAPAAEKVAADAAAAADKAPADAAAAAADAAAAAAAADKKDESGDGIVKFLQAQLKEKDERILALTVSEQGLKAELETAKASLTPCLEVVRGSIEKMRVALGGSKGDTAGLSATEALAEHARLSADFLKKFKVGGVASAKVEDKSSDKQGPAAAPLHAARIAAVRMTG